MIKKVFSSALTRFVLGPTLGIRVYTWVKDWQKAQAKKAQAKQDLNQRRFIDSVNFSLNCQL